jgi:DNA-binding response OmpR family regulator
MEAQSLEMAVRLADEGVPLRAIARATKIPSDDLRQTLHEAKLEGRLLELPHDDWPPGFPRDQRALQISRLMVENREVLLLSIQNTFRLTPTEARIFLLLLQNEALCRERFEGDPKCFNVHIWHLRQCLQAHGMVIHTVRNFGYQLASSDRCRAMDSILARIGQPAL